MKALRPAIICSLIILVQLTPAAGSAPYPGNRLAYITDGKLYVEGRLVPGPGIANRPSFSYDGRWLAFVRQSQQGTCRLWIAHADGSDARAVKGLPGPVLDFRWSPVSDRIAATASYGLWIMSATGGPPFDLAHDAPEVESFAWSPDGAYLAFSGRPSHLSRTDLREWLYTVPTVGGAIADTPRFVARPTQGHDNGILVAGWWPGDRGILFWLDPYHSSSIAADGLDLYSIDFPYGKVKDLIKTLTYSDWLAPAPAGNRILLVAGGPRPAFFGKHLMLCRRGGGCRAVVHQRGTVSFDPAWAPIGGWNSGSMAFVTAPAWHTWGFLSPARYRQWMSKHILWIANADGSGAEKAVGVPTGVEDPEWTRDGRGILFVSQGALWLDPHLGAANAHRIARLVPSGSVPNLQNPAYRDWYYGHMDWHELFAWY